MKAVDTGLDFVTQPSCCCPSGIYQTVWDRLLQQMFGRIPPGMDTETILPSIRIWKDFVQKIDDTTFSVLDDGVNVPQPADVILYKGQYYIIGEVDAD